MDIKQAIEQNYGNIVLEFGKRKSFKVPGYEECETDKYGHLEVDLNSFLMAEVGITETDDLDTATQQIRDFLLQHESDFEA